MVLRWKVTAGISVVAAWLISGGAALGQVAGETAAQTSGSWDFSLALWFLAPISGVLALIFAHRLYKGMMAQSEGEEKMREIAQYVRDGANAYLFQQYRIVAVFFVIFAMVIAFFAFVLKVQSGFAPFGFLTAGFFSGLAGFLGMKTATRASARTANAARKSLNEGLKVAFRSGAVMGLMVVGLAVLDISLWYAILTAVYTKGFSTGWLPDGESLRIISTTMLTFAMGASLQALFARVGGGIFTKAADVGADLVGKVEAGIPEDDPRNPATIADNVGDNVGDVAGMGADLYESYYGSILATCALGVAAGFGFKGIALPMVIAGLGTMFSILGIFMVRTREGAGQRELIRALNTGVFLASALVLAAAIVMTKVFLPDHFGVAGSIVVGLLAGLGIGFSAEYYTSADYSPTKSVARQALTGPATVIIEGLATGMISTGLPVLIVGTGVLLAFGLAGGFTNASYGLYGVGIAAVGMLSTLGITLATDAYGPIADNAGGNAEMSGLGPEVRKRTDALDSLGNTTAATGKGFAIGSAALTALALVAAYIEQIRAGLVRIANHAADGLVYIGDKGYGVQQLYDADINFFMEQYHVNLMNPKVLVGIFLGAMMAFVFCAFTMKAVGRAAGQMVEEVRRQFREIAGIMEGEATPDYAACVQISTRAAQREMILPSLLAIAVPVATGLVLGVAGVVGLLIGGLATGFTLAVMMANAGGSWDNAKKYIESGAHGGKGSDAHKAAVVGDTVGDPFKDTSGPSLNILIKLMTMVSVVFAGVIVKFAPAISRWLHMVAD